LDRPRRRPGVLIARLGAGAALALVCGLAAAAVLTAPPLRAMRWLAPGVDAARALTRRPSECLGAAPTAAGAYEIELGRAAFRTPLTLGGQAARAGLSCETCHRSGRDNPCFDFRGVSGAPGTADVTTSVFSSHRGDDVFDPRPIPNLSGPKSLLKVDQDPASGKLDRFIDGIVTQEFDGAEPPPAVLKGLAAYVRALAPANCPAAASAPVSAAADLADARRAVRAALAALAHRDPDSAIAMAEAARSRLGDVAERYAAATLAPQRRRLAVAAIDLAAAESAIRRDRRAGADALVLWLARSRAWGPKVAAAQGASLYDRGVLEAAARRYEAGAATAAASGGRVG